jgi:hypothetical protein
MSSTAFDPHDFSDLEIPLPDFSSDEDADIAAGAAAVEPVNCHTTAAPPAELSAGPAASPPADPSAGEDGSVNCAVLRVGPGPAGLGVCLFTTHPIKKGDVVLEEVGTLMHAPLPPERASHHCRGWSSGITTASSLVFVISTSIAPS